MARRTGETGIAVRIVCALSLLFLGLSHRMPVPAKQPAVMLAYALPDGSKPDLCLPLGQKKLHFSGPGCEACRLAGSVLLPEPPALAAFVFEPTIPAYTLPVRAAIAAVLDRAQSARGPPAILLS